MFQQGDERPRASGCDLGATRMERMQRQLRPRSIQKHLLFCACIVCCMHGTDFLPRVAPSGALRGRRGPSREPLPWPGVASARERKPPGRFPFLLLRACMWREGERDRQRERGKGEGGMSCDADQGLSLARLWDESDTTTVTINPPLDDSPFNKPSLHTSETRKKLNKQHRGNLKPAILDPQSSTCALLMGFTLPAASKQPQRPPTSNGRHYSTSCLKSELSSPSKADANSSAAASPPLFRRENIALR